MFTDEERNEMVEELLMIIESEKAGRADGRRALAEKLVDSARDFLRDKYNAGNDPQDNKSGMWQTRDTLTPKDFKQS